MTAPALAFPVSGRWSLDQLRLAIDKRREMLGRLHALVDGAQLLADVLVDLDRLEAPPPAPELVYTLAAAARKTGWSADHLGRMVRSGEVKNYGRVGAPRVKLADIPVKATGIAHRRRSLAPSTGNGRASHPGDQG